MENSSIKDIGRNAKDYLDLQLELIKLEAVNKASSAGASAITGLILLFFAFTTVIILSVAIGLVLSWYFESYIIGFAVLGGIYLLKLIVLTVWKDFWLIRPIRNRIIEQAFSEKNKDGN